MNLYSPRVSVRAAGFTCYLHPEAVAHDRCAACARTICPVCVVADARGRTLCRSCSDRAQARRRRVRGLIVAAGALAVVGVAGYLLVFHAAGRAGGGAADPFAGDKHAIPPEAAERMAQYRVRLEANPCEVEAAYKLGGVLNGVGDYAGALALCDRFATRCGDATALAWVKMYALEQTKSWNEAIALASELVADHPHHPDYWWWRGEAEAETGELDQAAADDRQSQAVYPSTAVVNLASVARRRERACDGAFAVAHFLDEEPGASARYYGDLESKLWVEGDCTTVAGRGRAAVHIDRVDARLAGHPGRFRIDLTLAHVVVTRDFATRAALIAPGAQAGPSVTILLGGEPVTAEVARVADIAVGGASARDFEVMVVDGLPNPPAGTHAARSHDAALDGLLGQDFLWRFARPDFDARGHLVLTERRAPP